MTKEKQIEEMARDIFVPKVAIDGIDIAFASVHGADKPDSHFMRIAQHLYNAGYRKLDEEEIDVIKRGMHFLFYSMCLQLNLGREIFVKYIIQLNNWFENYKKTQKIGAKMDGKEAEAKIKEVEKKK